MITKKYTNIQNVWFNGKKATRYEIYDLIGGCWIRNGGGMVNGWFKTARSIKNQQKREGEFFDERPLYI